MVKAPEYPAALATGLEYLDDVPMPEARIVINANFTYLDGKPSGSGGGLADPGANGLVKRTALNVTAMAVAGADYQSALGFTPENVANRDTDILLTANSDTKYASQKAIKSYVDTGLASSQPVLGYTPENVANRDTDATLAANSDTRYPSQKAVKAYAVPMTRRVLAGAGMGGGGVLSADVTLTANVVSVFGRTGAVTLSTSDIVTAGGVPASRLISTDGVTLTGGGDLSADRTLAVAPDSVVEKVRISAAGALVGTRREVNFISGANVTVSIADDIPNNRVNVSIASTGGAGGMVDPTTTRGDLIVKPTGAAPTRLGVGADAFVLTADAAQTLGMRWAAVANTVFGRSGTVVAQTGDYTAAQVGAVPTARQVIAGAGMSGGGALTGDVTLNANVTSVFGRTGAVTLTAADISGAGGVPNTRQVIAGTGLTGGGVLSADVTLTAKAMGASGPVSHSAGIVPDPGVTAGTARFLREDATWVAPPDTTGMLDPTTTKGDIIARGAAAPATRLGVGTDGQVLAADSSQGLGIKWTTPAPTAGPACSAYMTGASPTFLMGVATAVPFNATEFDSSGGAMHSNTVSNTRVIAPSTGYYLVIASHQFNSPSTGTVAKVVVNGTTDVTGSQTQAVITSFVTAAVAVCLYLTAGQYVEYFITAVSADAPVFTFTDAPRAAPRLQLIRLF